MYLVLLLLTQSCSQSDDFIDKQSVFEEEIVEEEIDFPKQVEAYGKAVAKEIEITVAKLNDLNMDYSEVVDFKDFRKKFYEDWYNASPTMARSRATGKIQSIEMMSATEFMERYNSLTDIQLEFIHKIIGECEKSRSSQDLLARLVALNKEIHAQVPEIEQERLLNVIAVLYYGGQKIVYLEHQGLMLRTPYNNIKLSKVKTRGPEDGGNIGENGVAKLQRQFGRLLLVNRRLSAKLWPLLLLFLLRQDSFMRLFCVKKMRETAIWIFAWKSTWAVRVLVMVTLILEGGDIQCVNDVLTIV